MCWVKKLQLFTVSSFFCKKTDIAIKGNYEVHINERERKKSLFFLKQWSSSCRQCTTDKYTQNTILSLAMLLLLLTAIVSIVFPNYCSNLKENCSEIFILEQNYYLSISVYICVHIYNCNSIKSKKGSDQERRQVEWKRKLNWRINTCRCYLTYQLLLFLCQFSLSLLFGLTFTPLFSLFLFFLFMLK